MSEKPLNLITVFLHQDGKRVVIGKPNDWPRPKTKDETRAMIVLDMATLCEGICTLIHVAENEGLKPSADSVRDCIKHLQDGFADASYNTEKL